MLMVSEYPMFDSMSWVDETTINTYYLNHMSRTSWDKITNVYNLNVSSATPEELYGHDMYIASFDGYNNYSTLVANIPMTVTLQYTNDIIRKGESFKLNFRNKTIYRFGADGSGSYSDWNYLLNNPCTVNISRVYVGQSMASLQLVTPSNGLYTANVNVRYIVVALAVGGRAVSFLNASHGYMFLDRPSVIVYTPDPVVTQQTLEQTNSINRTIQDTTQQQTNTLMGTGGSDGIVSGVQGTTTQQIERLPITSFVGEITEYAKTTLNTTEQDGTVSFPGISLMGFTIQPAEIDPWDYAPEFLHERVRVVVTFVFVVAFLHHIVSLFEAIFGIYHYGVMAEGTDAYDMGPQPVKWKGDYSIDEDLGF